MNNSLQLTEEACGRKPRPVWTWLKANRAFTARHFASPAAGGPADHAAGAACAAPAALSKNWRDELTTLYCRNLTRHVCDGFFHPGSQRNAGSLGESMALARAQCSVLMREREAGPALARDAKNVPEAPVEDLMAILRGHAGGGEKTRRASHNSRILAKAA